MTVVSVRPIAPIVKPCVNPNGDSAGRLRFFFLYQPEINHAKPSRRFRRVGAEAAYHQPLLVGFAGVPGAFLVFGPVRRR